MNDGEALVMAILQSPAEDTPRLAYADWLEENAGTVKCHTDDGTDCHGTGRLDGMEWQRLHKRCSGTGRVSDGRRERAEFIRVQVELARLDGCSAKPGEYGGHFQACGCKWHVLRRREGDLWLNEGPQACLNMPEVPGVPRPVLGQYSRGFVARLEMTWSAWRTHAAAITARLPIERVRLTTVPDVRNYSNRGEGGSLVVCLASLEKCKYFISRDEIMTETWDQMRGRVTMSLLRMNWPNIKFELPARTEVNFPNQDETRTAYPTDDPNVAQLDRPLPEVPQAGDVFTIQ